MTDDGLTLEDQIAALKERYEALQEQIALADITERLGEVATEITGLPGEIEALRERGYAFAGYLENKAGVLATQWDEIRQQVREHVRSEMTRVQASYDQIAGHWQQLDAQWSDQGKQNALAEIERVVNEVEGAVENARERIEGLYGNVPENVNQTQSQLRTLGGYLDLADEATVSWGPAEAIFLAVKAEWVQTGKGKKDPDGILYLSDQRLIFEQKEKVGGRFGMGGEQVQEVLFETPVGVISEAQAENKGMLGGKDMVHLKFSSGDQAEMTLEVKGGVDCKWYVQQLNRVITGEIEKERAIPVDEAVVEAVQNAPTACTTCGATLPTITRGMTEVACEYCGTVVRI